MWTPILKRMLLFVPMLIGITLLAFILSNLAPGDPIDRICGNTEEGNPGINQQSNLAIRTYWRKKLGLDLPLFYLTIKSSAVPDTLYRIPKKQDRETLERLLWENGNWPATANYYKQVQAFQSSLNAFRINEKALTNNESKQLQLAEQMMHQLQVASTESEVKFACSKLSNTLNLLPIASSVQLNYYDLEKSVSALFAQKSTWKNYLPVLQFQVNNRYHRWLFGDGNWLTGAGSTDSKGILRGDFGISYNSKESVLKLLYSPIPISLFFAFLSLLLAGCISLPLAAYAALHPNSHFDKLSSSILFILYALPPFFVASLLLFCFANPDVFALFPSSGIAPLSTVNKDSTIDKILDSLPYLVLPMICYTYSSLAFFSRAMRASLIANLELDYVRTARAKGLSYRKLLYLHVLKNAILPFLALLAQIFPYAIGGAVLLETIFTLPGMGLLTYNAVLSQDYPVIIAVFTLSGLMTLIGTLICDVLMIAIDPRMKITTVNR